MTGAIRHVSFSLDGEPWRIPYWDTDSGRPGPCLLVSASVHGREINGAEAILRWIHELPSTLKRGRVLALPWASLPAVRVGRQAERDELGKLQVWPGAPDGNRKEQVYHALHEALVVQATHAIDLHSYEDTQAAEALTREDAPGGMALGLAAAFPFTRILSVPPEGREHFPPPPGGKVAPCTLERLMSESGRVGVTLELSGQGHLIPSEVQRGIECLRRMGAHLGMVSASGPPAPATVRIHMPRDTDRGERVTAPGYGMLLSAGKRPGDDVAAGEVIAEWAAEDSLEIEAVRAPVSGRLQQLGVRRPKAKGETPHGTPHPPAPFPYAWPDDVLAIIIPP